MDYPETDKNGKNKDVYLAQILFGEIENESLHNSSNL